MKKSPKHHAARLTIIIPTLNEAGFLPRLLKDLHEQTRPADQILIVDGGSQDQTIKLAKRWPKVEIIETAAGVGQQRNAGAKKAQGNWLMFLDADNRLSSNFLADSLAQLEAKQLEAACPIYQPLTRDWRIKLAFAVLNLWFWLGQFGFAAGAGPAIFIQRQLFKKLGGFRSYRVAEDLDLVHRAGKEGHFRLVSVKLGVSVRRFERYGFWRTSLVYAAIAALFMIGKLEWAAKLPYQVGDHQPKPAKNLI